MRPFHPVLLVPIFEVLLLALMNPRQDGPLCYYLMFCREAHYMAHSLAPFLAIPFPSLLSHAAEAVTRSVMERLFILGGEINYPPFWAKPHFKVVG